nr:MAG TPA: hypothetical protein [Caudoviricetes sp.]
MKYTKQALIDEMKRSIKRNEEKKPSIRNRVMHERDGLERWNGIR